MPVLKPLTTNKFIARDSFYFTGEIFDQQPHLFIGSLDVDYLLNSVSSGKLGYLGQTRT